MKSILSITAFILVGLFTAYAVGFHPYSSSNKIPFDSEQNGLNQQIIIKFSHVVAENTPKGLTAQLFAKLVQEKTNNRVKVEVFPNGTLYSDKTEINALKKDQVQIIAPAFSKLTNVSPEWGVLDLPYLFQNQQAVEDAFHGKIGQQLFESLKQQNMKGLAFWNNGFKQMTSDVRPLILPQDFAGQRFRIMPSQVIQRQFELFHATSSIIPFNQTYRNLDHQNIDGQENTLSNIYSKKFYKVQKYMTISNHGYLGYAVIMNKSFWDKLPKSVQKVITDSMNEATQWIQKNSYEINQEALKKMEQSNIQIHVLTPQEKEKWVKQLNPIYQEFAPVIGKKLMTQVDLLRKKYELQPETKASGQ